MGRPEVSDSSRLATVLYWLMVLLGAAVLAPCLVLPAWLEYQASLDLKALREQQVARREAQLTRLRKQREHLETDEAYVLRLAHQHLNIETPGVRRIPVEPGRPAERDPAAPAATAPLPTQEAELVPELSAMVEQAVQRYPLVQMFVRPESRPSLLFIGAGLIVTALVLLGPRAPLRTE